MSLSSNYLFFYYFFLSLHALSLTNLLLTFFCLSSLHSSHFLLSILSTSIRLTYPHFLSPPSFFFTSTSLFSASFTLYSLSPSFASLAHFSHQIELPPYHPKKSTNMDLLVVHGVSLLTNRFFFFWVVHGGLMDILVGLPMLLTADL